MENRIGIPYHFLVPVHSICFFTLSLCISLCVYAHTAWQIYLFCFHFIFPFTLLNTVEIIWKYDLWKEIYCILISVQLYNFEGRNMVCAYISSLLLHWRSARSFFFGFLHCTKYSKKAKSSFWFICKTKKKTFYCSLIQMFFIIFHIFFSSFFTDIFTECNIVPINVQTFTPTLIQRENSTNWMNKNLYQVTKKDGGKVNFVK